jgi:ribonuclease Z
MTKFELTVLGTSSALPTSQRYPTAHVLNVHERFFLIDCGEGTQIQLRRHHIKFTRINHIFISHLHGDHYFGLIGILSTFALLQRQNDLHIYAHSELPEILKTQLEFIGADICYKIIWHPLNFKRQQVVLDNDEIEVTSFPLKHRIACCGFLFREKPGEKNLNKETIQRLKIPIKDLQRIKNGLDYVDEQGITIPNEQLTLPMRKMRSYAFCTDTIYLPSIIDIIKDVDLLYHEATYSKTLSKQAEQTYHSTTEQAAMIARCANASQLLIGHFSARYKETDELLAEAKEVFSNTRTAIEGNIYTIE